VLGIAETDLETSRRPTYQPFVRMISSDATLRIKLCQFDPGTDKTDRSRRIIRTPSLLCRGSLRLFWLQANNLRSIAPFVDHHSSFEGDDNLPFLIIASGLHGYNSGMWARLRFSLAEYL
jgi:hypothetical protein